MMVVKVTVACKSFLTTLCFELNGEVFTFLLRIPEYRVRAISNLKTASDGMMGGR